MTEPGLFAFLADQWLLSLALIALLAWFGGHLLHNHGHRAGPPFKGLGYFLVAAVLLLTVADTTRRATRSDAALLMGAKRDLIVSGRETIVPAASDGHYWVEAEAGGKSFDFLIDTGATYTGLSREAAAAIGLQPDPSKLPVQLQTANGMITAKLATLPELRFGNVAVRDLEVAISPVADDDTNLIGMNLLSQLASWRVEDGRLILVPRGVR